MVYLVGGTSPAAARSRPALRWPRVRTRPEHLGAEAWRGWDREVGGVGQMGKMHMFECVNGEIV